MFLKKISRSSALILAGCVMMLSACASKGSVNGAGLKDDLVEQTVVSSDDGRITDESATTDVTEVSKGDESGTLTNETNNAKDDTSGDQTSDTPSESTTAKKLWRVYRLDENESSIERYLYLEIYQDSGKVQIYHSYYSENTYSYIDWPISDGIIEVKEYSADGGAPFTWDVYIEYTPEVIKLYNIDDNSGEIIDSYDESIFESEDVLE